MVASRIRRSQRKFTFVLLASLFKAGNLPVFELDSALQFPTFPVLFVQGVGKFSVGGKGVLKAKRQVTKKKKYSIAINHSAG